MVGVLGEGINVSAMVSHVKSDTIRKGMVGVLAEGINLSGCDGKLCGNGKSDPLKIW